MPKTRPPSRPSPEALDALAQARAARGGLLFHLALAESVAGDALAGRPPPETVGGWALDVGAAGYEVVALGVGEAADILVRVTFGAGGAPIVEDRAGGPASPRQAALARAREAGAAHGRGLGGRWLALPIPPPRDAPLPAALEVWLLRSPERAQDLVAGPHWRLEVSVADGLVADARLACSADGVIPDAPLAAPNGLVLVHADDDTPSEAHVMLSLRHGAPLEVHTPRSGLRWRVEGEAVRRLTGGPAAQRRA